MTFHLSRPWLDGPAERTLIEPWLTSLSTSLNAYPEPEPVLAPVESLPLPLRRTATRRRMASVMAA